jgi:membrane protease YdiL (CAAX protease family)
LGFFFTLFTMAVTPALCEELFFRGYIQRQSERLFRTWLPAILFTGIVFGLYHMRLTQAVPLSMLGVYMAYVVWVSNSLVPGILVHLLNNGFAVALGAYIAGSDTLSLQDIEAMEIPPLVIIVSAAAFALVMRIMHKQAPIAGGEATDE